MPHAFAVRKLTNFTKSKNVRSIQFDSFHGVAYRDLEKKLWTKASYDDAEIAPLHIVRDGNLVPPITRPGLHYIVNGQIKAQLEKFPHIRFEQVVIDKIVDFFYAKGDFSIYRNADPIDEEQLLLSRPDVPKLHARIGSHYEVIAPHHIRIAKEYSDTTEVAFNENGRPIKDDDPFLRLSPRMFADYPLQYFGNWHLMSPAVFEVFEPSLDFDYFVLQRLDY